MTGPPLGTASSPPSAAPSLAAAVVEPASVVVASSAASARGTDAPPPAASPAIERPASPFAATLEKAVARAEQQTELIDVRKLKKRRRAYFARCGRSSRRHVDTRFAVTWTPSA
ncbi:MAG: hypothetical protein IT379_27500 [Deltaproteobacteria bacterium]|nr:hypothetical protein [Deltaproteobacteria bacterium]